jgi:hypothetical protein
MSNIKEAIEKELQKFVGKIADQLEDEGCIGIEFGDLSEGYYNSENMAIEFDLDVRSIDKLPDEELERICSEKGHTHPHCPNGCGGHGFCERCGKFNQAGKWYDTWQEAPSSHEVKKLGE